MNKYTCSKCHYSTYGFGRYILKHKVCRLCFERHARDEMAWMNDGDVQLSDREERTKFSEQWMVGQ